MQHVRKVTGAVALTFAALTMTGGLAGVAGAAGSSAPSVTVPNLWVGLGTWMDTPVAATTLPVWTPMAVASSPTQTLPNVGAAIFFCTNDVADVTSTSWVDGVAPLVVRVNAPSTPVVPQAPGVVSPLTAVTVPLTDGELPAA